MSHRAMVTEVEGHQARTPEDTEEEDLLHPITEVAGDLPVHTREEGPPLHIPVIVSFILGLQLVIYDAKKINFKLFLYCSIVYNLTIVNKVSSNR